MHCENVTSKEIDLEALRDVERQAAHAERVLRKAKEALAEIIGSVDGLEEMARDRLVRCAMCGKASSLMRCECGHFKVILTDTPVE